MLFTLRKVSFCGEKIFTGTVFIALGNQIGFQLPTVSIKFGVRFLSRVLWSINFYNDSLKNTTTNNWNTPIFSKNVTKIHKR